MKTVSKKYQVFLLSFMALHNTSFEQSKTGIENYQYMADRSGVNLVSIIHHQTKRGLYTELRYNYEELHTASVYAGRTLLIGNNKNFSFTPMAGLVMGNYTGGSLAMNTDLEYKSVYFSSQAQYTVNKDDANDNFFYNWAELGYNLLPWLYTGVTVQQTLLRKMKMETAAGFTTGFVRNKWSVPVYFFNPFRDDKYFVIGINYEWEPYKKTK